jgi:DNA modification methylase
LYGWKDGGSHYFFDSRAETTTIEDSGLDFKKMKKEDMQKLLEQIYSDKMSTSVLYENKPTRNDLHPTMKPVSLMGRLIANSTRRNEKVLDLFGGSGSTLIACEQLNRKCYMMELDPHYCDVIIDRWQKLTGKTAVKIEQQ